MAIVVDIDVMMARRKLSAGALADLIGITQPDQGDGRPRLPLGQPVLGLFRSLFVHARQALGDLFSTG